MFDVAVPPNPRGVDIAFDIFWGESVAVYTSIPRNSRLCKK